MSPRFDTRALFGFQPLARLLMQYGLGVRFALSTARQENIYHMTNIRRRDTSENSPVYRLQHEILEGKQIRIYSDEAHTRGGAKQVRMVEYMKWLALPCPESISQKRSAHGNDGSLIFGNSESIRVQSCQNPLLLTTLEAETPGAGLRCRNRNCRGAWCMVHAEHVY